MQTQKVQMRIEPRLKAAVETIFAELGLTASEAVRLFYQQVKIHRGLPFELRIPNATTRAAMREAQLIIKGKKKSKSHTSAKAMLKDILTGD